jgi:hypothetical protein
MQQHANIDINIWAKETDNPIEVDATAYPKISTIMLKCTYKKKAMP